MELFLWFSVPSHIQGHETDKAGDLHEEINEDCEAGIDGKRVDRGHVGERAKKEARGFGEGGQQHGGRNLTHHATKVFLNGRQ